MKILVLGATGMLGYQIFKTSIIKGFDVQGIVRNKNSILSLLGDKVSERLKVVDDVKNIASIEKLIKNFQPTFLINCIGIIKQSELSDNLYESIAINSFLPHQLEKLGSKYNFRLIHISTDCVFDGMKGGYKETDHSNAMDYYGKTKYLGEVNYGSGITLRTSIIGHSITENKHGLLDWFLSKNGSVNGYTNAFFSGLTTVELTKVIFDTIITKGVESGLYHIASQPISKFNLLEMVSQVYEKKIEIIPSNQFKIDRTLDASKFLQLTSYSAPSWFEMINEVCKSKKDFNKF